LQIHRLNPPPQKKKFLLGPFNGWKHQRFSTTQNAIKSYCMMFKETDEGKKEAVTNHNVSAKKRKTLNK